MHPAMIVFQEGDYIVKKHDRDAVYRFLLAYMQRKSGASPVYRQIMEACGIRSLSTVSRILHQLQKEGRIVVETRAGSRPLIIVTGARWIPPLEEGEGVGEETGTPSAV